MQRRGFLKFLGLLAVAPFTGKWPEVPAVGTIYVLPDKTLLFETPEAEECFRGKRIGFVKIENF